VPHLALARHIGISELELDDLPHRPPRVQLEQINEAMDELDAGRAVRQIIEFPED
jgi:Zn-dependent alcohol dehydrogenase